MSDSTFIALFSVAQTTTNVDEQVEFYQSFGFVIDDGYEALEDAPDKIFTARGIKKSDIIKSIAMKQPTDPYMHLVLTQFKEAKKGPCWPATFDQLGTRGFSALVGDAAAEIARIKRDFPDIKVLQEPISMRRKWGKTTTALVIDPEDVYFELIEIEKGSKYDPKTVQAPKFHDVQWLHFMLNCENYAKTTKFYNSFGLFHDPGVDFRPNVGFYPSLDAYSKQMDDAFEFKQHTLAGVGFLRHDKDVSLMHLELMDYTPGSLKDPDDKPTWIQKGICRYCFRVPDYYASLERQKKRGTKFYIEDQRACLEWGDSQWFFSADFDGNINTEEQWYPCRYWGERE